jgi:hypothetical protein
MLTVKSDNDIQVKLGDQLETLLTNMLPYKYLIGMVAGTIPTPDVKDYADKVGLTFSLRDGRLIGEAIAFKDMVSIHTPARRTLPSHRT